MGLLVEEAVFVSSVKPLIIFDGKVALYVEFNVQQAEIGGKGLIYINAKTLTGCDELDCNWLRVTDV